MFMFVTVSIPPAGKTRAPSRWIGENKALLLLLLLFLLLFLLLLLLQLLLLLLLLVASAGGGGAFAHIMTFYILSNIVF